MWTYNDGGRAQAGYTTPGKRDCVTRAFAIAEGISYRDACALVDEAGAKERRSKRRRKGKSSSQTGVYIPTIRRLLTSRGWQWTPTMFIGSGTTVHLKAEELPSGRLIVSVSRHYVAVVDGVVHDTYDPSRGGTRCVYGYYRKPSVR